VQQGSTTSYECLVSRWTNLKLFDAILAANTRAGSRTFLEFRILGNSEFRPGATVVFFGFYVLHPLEKFGRFAHPKIERLLVRTVAKSAIRLDLAQIEQGAGSLFIVCIEVDSSALALR
jgi:hypothetical protein